MTAKKAWTDAQVRALGAKTDVATAGSVLAGLSRTQSYEAVRRGTFPVPVIRVGRRLVVPMQPVLELLHLDKPAGGPSSSEAPPALAVAPSPKGHDAANRNPAA